jgi:regulator of protease activity HflC (stomatin/prohibitin superfamily)
MIREREVRGLPGGLTLAVLLASFVALLSAVIAYIHSPLPAILLSLALGANVLAMAGFFVVHPNQARVLQLFGRYVGTVREPGLKWSNPFYTKRTISLRIRNFESNKLKVNDHDGSPIEIAAVVVWRVVDTAEAAFEVDDYDHFVHFRRKRRCATWLRDTLMTPTTTAP